MNGTAKFEVAAEFIRDKIRSGEWPSGHKLPSQQAWASGTPGLKILYGTLRGCYITLRTEGWIRGQQGEGVFVAEEPPIVKPVATAGKTKNRT